MQAMDDLEINALLTRLSRPHSSGGVVIERAAILAAGADFPAVMDWIAARAGTPDTTVAASRDRGLHGSRLADGSAVLVDRGWVASASSTGAAPAGTVVVRGIVRTSSPLNPGDSVVSELTMIPETAASTPASISTWA